MKTSLPSPNQNSLSGPQTSKSNTFVLVLVSFFIAWGVAHLPPHQNSDLTIAPPSLLASCPWQPKLYQRPHPASSVRAATAVLIPHHLLAAPLIHRALSQIDPSQIQTIILVGPNHFNQDIPLIQTTQNSWRTPFGQVMSADTYINDLTSLNLANIVDHTFIKEHSICGPVGFLPVYFREAQLIPLVLRHNAPKEIITSLATYLAKNCNHCLLIASVDFTHEQSSQMATINDTKSIQILTSLNLDRVSEIVADSPPSLQLLLEYTRLRGIKQGSLIGQQDSNYYSTAPLPTVTSYVSVLF